MESERFINAQRQLREALAREPGLLDDADAVALLEGAGRGVLSVVEGLLAEDAMWARFGSADAHDLSAEEVEQLARFADSGLRTLLEGLGYQEPPSINRLVDDTVERLYLAVIGHDDATVAARRVQRARADLSLFAIRLRRLIGSAYETRPSLARRLLRAADRNADEVMTAVAPVLVETAAAALPGVGSLLAKLGAAVGGVLVARLGALRRQRMPEVSEQSAADARERAQRALARVEQIASVQIADGDELVLQSWIAEEAARRLQSYGAPHTTVEPALRALRALRYAIAVGDVAAARACAVTATAALPMPDALLDWNLLDDPPTDLAKMKAELGVDSLPGGAEYA